MIQDLKNRTAAIPIYAARIGTKHTNNQGYALKVVNYLDADHVTVEFQDEYKAKVKTQWEAIINGTVKNPYHPDVCGVGITGNKYSTSSNTLDGNIYGKWKAMIRRCFDNKEKEKYQAYRDATCCDEWLVFDNFYEWIVSQENYNVLKGTNWNIDKDILFKWNKTYSPDTCCIVPKHVNVLFVRRVQQRGKWPIGVYYDQKRDKYSVRCNYKGVGKSLGRYDNPQLAFNVYKQYKENVIKEIAMEEMEKGTISRRCYEAMMAYHVEITD